MRDIYLYEGSKVLRNLLGIRDQAELEKAEADYVSFRLKDIARNPLQGHYDYAHLLQMHRFIFQDLYDWAGQQRKVNIYKEEAVLGGLSIDYSDVFDIARDAEKVLAEMRHKEWQNMSIHEKAVQFSDSLAKLWKIHPFREGNTRTTVTFCCQYADEIGLRPNRELFEDNAAYLNISEHLGSAMIHDRKIVVGQHGYSSTVEHIQLNPKGAVCYCGKSGCIETVCSMSAVLQGDDEETFFAGLRSGGQLEKRRWKAFLRGLGRAINNMHLLYDKTFVLGGYLSSYLEEEDIETLYDEISQMTPFPEVRDYIFISKMPKHSITIGAALPYIREFLAGELIES